MEREYGSNRARISSVVARERAGDNRHKLRHTKFPLSLEEKKKKKYFFLLSVRLVKHWHRLPGVAVGSPSLETISPTSHRPGQVAVADLALTLG